MLWNGKWCIISPTGSFCSSGANLKDADFLITTWNLPNFELNIELELILFSKDSILGTLNIVNIPNKTGN